MRTNMASMVGVLEKGKNREKMCVLEEESERV